MARWNGHAWAQAAAPQRPHTVGWLPAVSAASATGVWAAGSDIDLRDYSYHTLVQHVCPG